MMQSVRYIFMLEEDSVLNLCVSINITYVTIVLYE